MTTPLPAPLPPAVRKWLGVLVDLGDADAGRLGSGRAVYELLYGLCCEVYRERLPSGDAPPDDLHARKLGEGLTRELAAACGYLGEDEHPSWGVLIAALRAGWVEPDKGGDAPPGKCKGCDGHGSYPEVDRYDGHTEDFTCPDCNGTGKGGDAPQEPSAQVEELCAEVHRLNTLIRELEASRPPGGAEPGLREAIGTLADDVLDLDLNIDGILGRLRALASEGAAHPQPTPDAMTRGAEAIISAWIESGEPTGNAGRALIRFDISEVLAPYATDTHRPWLDPD